MLTLRRENKAEKVDGKVIDIQNIASIKNKDKERDKVCFPKDELKIMIEEFTKSILAQGANQILKKWIPVKKSFSLEYHLGKLSKEDLTLIAVNLCIDKAGSLKKEELKTKILEVYEDRAIMLIDNMDRKRFEYLLGFVNKSGYDSDIENDNLNQIFYFRERAFLFTVKVKDENVIIMPQELQQIITDKNNLELIEQFEKNEEIIKLFWGMCIYYGIIVLTDFKELLIKYVDFDLSNINYEVLLRDGSDYYLGFNFNGCMGSDIVVDDTQYVLFEQIKRPHLDYYIFKKEELLKAAKIDFVEESEAYNRFHSFLTYNYGIEKQEAHDLIFSLQCNLKNENEFSDVAAKFLNNFELSGDEEAAILDKELFNFSNNVRQWILKGYTPVEANTSIEKEKVVNYFLCPCGSGNMYKECCGK